MEVTAPHLRGPADRVSLLVWLRLARIYHRIDRRSAAHLRGHGLTVAQFDVLAQIGAHPGLSQRDLAAVLFVTKGNIAQLLERMVALGLVERRPEGRTNRLHLTELGRARRAAALPSQEAVIAEALAVLPPAERRTLLRRLTRLERGLRSEIDRWRGQAVLSRPGSPPRAARGSAARDYSARPSTVTRGPAVGARRRRVRHGEAWPGRGGTARGRHRAPE